MKTIRIAFVCVAVAAVVLPNLTVADQHEDGEVAKAVMAMAYEQWKAFAKRDVAKAMSQVADDYTEFNPVAATRIDGKALNMRMAEAGNEDPSETILAEMLNPKVQVYGDVAILSYNYMGTSKDKDGNTTPVRAKSTRVYVKQGGSWKLVHANFGADPVEN